MDPNKHITILGVLHIVYSSLGLLGGIIVFAIFAGIGVVAGQSGNFPHNGGPEALGILFALGTIIAGLLIVFSIPGIIGGIGLLKRKEWGRIVILIVGFFDLLHIPFGTALGAYTIWVLFNNETIKVFRPVMQQSPVHPAS
jgi:hypothetical protein